MGVLIMLGTLFGLVAIVVGLVAWFDPEARSAPSRTGDAEYPGSTDRILFAYMAVPSSWRRACIDQCAVGVSIQYCWCVSRAFRFFGWRAPSLTHRYT